MADDSVAEDSVAEDSVAEDSADSESSPLDVSDLLAWEVGKELSAISCDCGEDASSFTSVGPYFPKPPECSLKYIFLNV